MWINLQETVECFTKEILIRKPYCVLLQKYWKQQQQQQQQQHRKTNVIYYLYAKESEAKNAKSNVRIRIGKNTKNPNNIFE